VTKKSLNFYLERCTGCRICELACSIEKQKKFVPRKARLKHNYHYPLKDVVSVCRQCAFAPCAKTCPVEAISRDSHTGAWTVDSYKCSGCGICVEACPFEMIKISEDNIALKCDLCGGNPQCAQWCPTGALIFESEEKLGQKHREDFAERYVSILKNQKYPSHQPLGRSSL
jgi:carbon-monoxide dehydrogenase iron sulfur subunit